MTKPHLAGIALSTLLLVACDTADVAPATTAADESTTTSTTTTTAPTTTTTQPEPTRINERPPGPAFPLAAGKAFVWDLSLVPVGLEFEETGWGLILAFDRGFGLLNTAKSIPTTDRVIAGIGILGGVTPDEVAAEIEESPRTVQVEPVATSTLGGSEATAIDVLSYETSDEGVRCRGHYLDEATGPEGRPLVSSLAGCAWTRVWLVGIDRGTLVAYVADYQHDSGNPPEDLNYPTIESIASLITEFESAITIGR